MDFSNFKKKALEFKKKALKKWQEAIDYSAKKLWESGFTLKTVEELEKFIEKSKNTSSKDVNGKVITYKKRILIIFSDRESDFFKNMLYMLPILLTKSFSQNISFKLADISMENLNTEEYKIEKESTLCVFENTKLIKTITGEENIQKVVKEATLDINKTIDSL